MVQIDMDMPKRCSECPLLLNIKIEDGRWFYVCNNERKMRILFEHEGTEEAVDTLVEMPKPQWCSLKEAEPKRGKWIPVSQGVHGGYFECSECGSRALFAEDGVEELSNHCPECGAKMENAV